MLIKILVNTGQESTLASVSENLKNRHSQWTKY